MATNLNVTELDFDQIKDNLKNYLKQQTEFNDYNFEGSSLSTLLDVLAYNTHYNAVAAHYSLNEAFLDSAQIRGNVVTRAKLLGYTPRSVLAPRARINIVVNNAGQPNTPTELILPRGTKLTATVQGETYQYVVLNSQTAVVADNAPIFTFSNVDIAEGTYKTLLYRVDNDIESQKFQITDEDVDTSTLRVRVQENEEALSYDVYSRFESLLNVDSASQIYYHQENTNGRYEVYFGDGVIGRKPINNNIVTLDYVHTHGEESNGASTFELSSTIGGLVNASYTVTTVNDSAGGSDRESMESIRFNAPLTFTAQNRAVTSDDYRAIILKQFSNVASISTWGGEDNDPIDFGKVYIAVKPLTGDTLSDDEKRSIKNTVLKGKNIVSIQPEIVDPNFTNLELDVFFKYNPNLTDRTNVELQGLVRDTISNYNFNNLNKFDGVFRYSQLLKAIDNSDRSILNSTIRPYMFQTINGKVSKTENVFDLTFASGLFESGSEKEYIINSSAFKIGGVDHFFGDKPIVGSSNRTVIIYKVIGGENVTVNNNAGELNVSKGNVKLNSFSLDQDTKIRISVIPNSLDIAPKRDQLLNIDQQFVTINAEIDTISTAGASGSIDYTTNSRLR